MQVTIELPDDIAAALKGEWKDLPQRSLEAIAIEGYRTGVLSENQVRRLLNFESRFQVHALLKAKSKPERRPSETGSRFLALPGLRTARSSAGSAGSD